MRPGLMVRYVTSYVLLAVMFLAVPWSASPVSLHAQSPSSPEKERSSDGEVSYDEMGDVSVTLANGAIRPAQSTCDAPAPVLVSPVDTVSNDLENPTYLWEPVSGIDEYLFQVALDNDFTNVIEIEGEGAREDESPVRGSSFEDLDPDTTYYWRVASVCDNGQFGVFSTPASFQTGSGNVDAECTLPPPTLLEPVDGTQVDTLVPRIAWQREPGVYEYQYQLYTSPTFDTGFVDDITFVGSDPNKDSPVATIPGDNLQPDTLHYWRVASICADIDKQAAYSEAFTFRSGPAGGTFAPPPANLIAPADGTTTGSVRVTFLFSEVANAEEYEIPLYKTREYAEQDRPFRSLSTSDTKDTDVRFPEETVYWRVKTRNTYGWGTLSAISSFTTPALTASANVTPDGGGTLSPDPGYLTVNFPPGAVSEAVTLDFRLLSTPQQSLPNFRFANRAFTLEAFAGSQEIEQFAQPFTMIIEYDESDLLAAGISDPNELNLVFWNGTAWEEILPCAGCSINTTNQTVTVVLDHLTEFALVAPGPATTESVYLPLIRR
jgi:hypothetical protein